MLSNDLINSLPDLDAEEKIRLESTMTNLPEEKQRQFIAIYANRRKNGQTVLLLAGLGLLGFAGIHRMVTGQTGLGIGYFLTGGFCGVATIVDMISSKKIANNFNQKVMNEILVMVR